MLNHAVRLQLAQALLLDYSEIVKVQGVGDDDWIQCPAYVWTVCLLDNKSPQIVGQRSPMCLTNFYPAKPKCEPTEYFGAFATTMTSQRLSIQSVAPLRPLAII